MEQVRCVQRTSDVLYSSVSNQAKPAMSHTKPRCDDATKDWGPGAANPTF
jgi:hypothetical protein